VRRTKAALAVLALCVAGTSALADSLKFTVELAPDPQATTKSNGKGTANLAVDTASKTLTGTIEYSGLSAPPAVAEFEGPPPQQNGQPVEVPIALPGNVASPIKVSTQITDAAITGLKTGQWLLLLGTKQGPEIGGPVKPQ
jgi:hypothetical protein